MNLQRAGVVVPENEVVRLREFPAEADLRLQPDAGPLFDDAPDLEEQRAQLGG
jgi:hypothetical protein